MLSRDPRLDPQLPPEQWAAVTRLHRLRALAWVGVVAALVAGVAAYFWYPVDRTAGMPPENVVEAAGLAILRAGHYHFRLDLTGKSNEYPFPASILDGQFQRSPQAMHVSGAVETGESRIPLEYYLEGNDFYFKHPTRGAWVVAKNTPVPEATAFLPESLAAPFVGGVRRVEEMGRERLSGGQAVQYRLAVDPAVMLPQFPELRDDVTDYRLWVYTRTLQPARFSVAVVRRPQAGEKEQVTRFTYDIAWDFGPQPSVAVPAAVRAAAEDVGSAPEPTAAPIEHPAP